jgi:hypothetical protein
VRFEFVTVMVIKIPAVFSVVWCGSHRPNFKLVR